MKFRNVNTGHILSTSNKDCIAMMQSSPAYEEIIDKPVEAPATEPAVDAPAAEAPVEASAEEAAPAPKPKASKPKAKTSK